MKLLGYQRADGRIGFRNNVLILALSGCTSELVRRIADQVPGTTCFSHPNGCDLHYHDFELMGTILINSATHPNIGGVVLLSIGCASTLSLDLQRKIKASERLCASVGVQQGTSKAIAKGVKIAQEMVDELAKAPRTEVPFSALCVGTKCGASDQNSFEYCHPVVGKACDILVDKGATVVLSEDCELVGSAHLLAERAVNKEIGNQILKMAERVNTDWKSRYGISIEERFLESGSREEMIKASLDHAIKAGTTPITGFVDMSEIITGSGLVILNAPNTDLENTTCLAASGCNVILFTTGRGTVVGSPTAITVKVTATEKTYQEMNENIDVSVAEVIDHPEKLDSLAENFVEEIVKYANGELTKTELLRHYEVAIPIRGLTF